MYYAAGPDPYGGLERKCGMATSPDGINWTKYDDPNTTEVPYAKSDPVMQPSDSGFDSIGIHCSVLKTDTGWEMFYEGWSRTGKIGYATSEDGVHWSKYQDNPLFDVLYTFPSAVKVGSTYYLYYHLYHDAGQGSQDWDDHTAVTEVPSLLPNARGVGFPGLPTPWISTIQLY